MTPVKKTAKAADTAKMVEETVVAEAKVEEKAAPAKEEPKKAVAKKAAAPKKTAEKKAAAPKKAAEKKTAAPKKAAAKKAAPEATVMIEHAGRQFAAKAVLEQAINVYTDTHKGAEVKTIELYIKPEEGVAYYVVNGEGSADFKIEL